MDEFGITRIPAREEHTAFVGVDLGQASDPTAIAVIERQVSRTNKWEEAGHNRMKEVPLVQHRLRALRRLPLGMDYPTQAAQVAQVMANLPVSETARHLVVDQTGVGRPVYDIFDRAGLNPVGVTITAGDGQSKVTARQYRVSKLQLVSNLEAMFHARELEITKHLAEADGLRDELRDFRRYVTESGRATFAARVGQHDDLVLAVALAAWWLRERPQPGRRLRVGWA